MAIKEYRIGDICKIQRGSSPRPIQYFETKNKTKYPWAKISDLSQNKITKTENYLTNIDDLVWEKYMICNPGDLLLTCCATPGIPFINEVKNCGYHDGFLKIINNEKIILKKYLIYKLINDKDKLVKNGNGTIFINLNKSIVENFRISIPSTSVQQEIINIIEPFEELREKYLSKIKNLKSILFNYESEEENHKTFQELGNVSTIKTGKRDANFAAVNGKYRFFTCSINKQQFCDTYKYDDEIILLAGNGEIGEIKYYNGKFDAYQRTYIIKTDLIGNVYYSLLKNKKFFVNNSNGSVVKFLTLPVISSIKIDTNKELNELRYKIIKNIFYYEKIIEKISIIIENLICKFI